MSDHARQQRSASSSMGRDELNLVDFPIGTLTFQQPTGPDGKRVDEIVFCVNSFEDQAGKIVPKKVTTRTSSRYGFPTPKEEQLLVGLMLLSRLRNNFSHPRIHFRNSELLHLMGWADNGGSRRQLKQGLDRLQGVDLKYENSWSNDDGQKYEKEFRTGILDSYELTTLKSGRTGKDRELSWIQWSAEVFADIQKGNVKELNTDEFFSLQLPLAQRMYRFLDKHLVNNPSFNMELLAFAGHLGMSETKHIGKVKDRLKKSIVELEQLDGFVIPEAREQRYRRIGVGHWMIQFRRPSTSCVQLNSPSPTDHALPKTTNTSRSSTGSAAAALVRKFYKQWTGNESHRPSFHELKQAQEVIDQHGENTIETLLPQLIKLMRKRFPAAVAFGATRIYWHEAAKSQTKSVQQQRSQKTERDNEQQEQTARRQQVERKNRLRSIWAKLSKTEQAAIRTAVQQHANTFVRTRLEQHQFDDPLVELACLDELERRSNTTSQPT